MENFFRMQVPSLRMVVREPQCHQAILEMLSNVFVHLGIERSHSKQLVIECLKLVEKSPTNHGSYERQAQRLLHREGVLERLSEKLEQRSKLIHQQIRDHLPHGRTLDIGCGDGKVGHLLSQEGHEVHLTDVYKHMLVDTHGLPFKQFRQGQPLPYRNGEFDNAVLSTVLHHADNPSATLQEVHRVLKIGGHVAVIESVYGVNGSSLSAEERQKAQHFFQLIPEQQRWVNVFFDHFYNRVLHFSRDAETKVNVPFNFQTSEFWNKLFEAHGFRVVRTIDLGIDQPAVPECHTLHLLEKKG